MADAIKDVVREKYAKHALRVVEGSTAACCSPADNLVTGNLYDATE
jgi:hypothetical protein